jgi:hypothetical protein
MMFMAASILMKDEVVKIAIKAAAAASGVLVSLVMAQAAQSQTLKTGHYSINAAAVTPGQDGVRFQKYTPALFNNTSTAACFSAGVNLPHRATITNFVVWYRGGSTQPLTIQLNRTKLDDDVQNELSYGVLTDMVAPRKRQALPVYAPNSLVDNAQYSYGINLCMWPDGARFYGARITYAYRD